MVECPSVGVLKERSVTKAVRLTSIRVDGRQRDWVLMSSDQNRHSSQTHRRISPTLPTSTHSTTLQTTSASCYFARLPGGPDRWHLFNYVNAMSYKLQRNEYLYCCNNFQNLLL